MSAKRSEYASFTALRPQLAANNYVMLQISSAGSLAPCALHKTPLSGSSTLLYPRTCWRSTSAYRSCSSRPQSRPRFPPAAAKRNPYVELEQDLLPGGVPNTPWRRLLLRIKNTWTLRQLLELYAANHYKTAVFNDKHRTALFNRIPSLIYYRVINGEADAATCQQLSELLAAAAPELARSQAVRGIDARKLSQLLVCIARCGLLDTPLHILDPLVRELLRGGCQKLPRDTPDLLAELALALAALGWEEEQLWAGITSAATALLSGTVMGNSWGSSATSAAALPPPTQALPAASGGVQSGGGVLQANPFADEAVGGVEGFMRGVLPSAAPSREMYVSARPFLNSGDAGTAKAAAGLGMTAPSSSSSSSSSSMAPRRFLAQDVACLAQALAAAGVEDPVLLDLLAQEAARKAPIFKLQQLTAVLQAYSDLGWPHAELQAAAVTRLQQLLPGAEVGPALACGAALAELQPVPWGLLLVLGQQVLDAGRVLGKQQALQLLAVMASACQQQPAAVAGGGGGNAAQGAGSAPIATADSSSSSGGVEKRRRRTASSKQAVDGGALSNSSSSSSSRLPASLVKVVLAAVAGTPLSAWTGAEAEQAARSLAALQLQPPGASTAAVEALAAAAVAHSSSSSPQQLVGVLWGVSAAGCRDPLLLQVVVEAVMPGTAQAVSPSMYPASSAAGTVDSSRTSSSSSSSSSSSRSSPVPPSLDELLEDLPGIEEMGGQQGAPGPWAVAPTRRRSVPAATQPAAVDSSGNQRGSGGDLGVSQLVVIPKGGLATGRAAGKRRSVLQQLGVQGVAELLWALQQHGRDDLATLLMEDQVKPRRKKRS